MPYKYAYHIRECNISINNIDAMLMDSLTGVDYELL